MKFKKFKKSLNEEGITTANCDNTLEPVNKTKGKKKKPKDDIVKRLNSLIPEEFDFDFFVLKRQIKNSPDYTGINFTSLAKEHYTALQESFHISLSFSEFLSRLN